MFINPKTAIEQGWVTFPTLFTEETQKKCLQVNAIDFTIDKLYTIDERSPFFISEEKKQMRTGQEIVPLFDVQRQESYWRLDPHSVYDGISNFYVNVPEGVAAMLIVRSSFSRNGIYITSGLYDSGFKNYIGCGIHNRSGLAYISPGTRIGQLIFVKSESIGLYQGIYNNNVGQHWSENYKEQTK